MATSLIDSKITSFIAGKPWLKTVLTIAMAILGTAKGRGWFVLKYGIK